MTVKETLTPVLYILMRTDLESLNPGKAMAQACHAANMFQCDDQNLNGDHKYTKLIDFWFNEHDLGFGTTIVLGVTEAQMKAAVSIAQSLNFPAGIVNDPTYPIKDGEMIHTIPLDTCAYVFGDKDDTLLQAVVGNFRLHS